jgi:DNA-directed RNA polymerase subunit beta
MNVGQILETHLGWGARALGQQLNEMVEQKFGAEAIRQRLTETYSTDEGFKNCHQVWMTTSCDW